jgi:hypothetical protein
MGSVVKCTVIGLSSRPPREDQTPAGIVRVTWVEGLNGTVGVNVSVSPTACQVPGTLGLRAGCGNSAATGAEKVTWIGSLPSACRSPGAGVTDITRNGPGRVTPGLFGALGGGPSFRVSRYVPAPASSATIAAPIAITRVRGWRATPVPTLAPVAATCLLSSRPVNNSCSPSPGTFAHPALSITNGISVVTQRHERAYPARQAITHGRRKRKVRGRPSARLPGRSESSAQCPPRR